MSNLDLLLSARHDLCSSKEREGFIDVATTFFFDGESMNFRLEEIAPKTLKLYTAPCFLEWLAHVTIDSTEYAQEIKNICSRFKAEWDGESISITFKRNELSLAQAYFKLIECMGIVGSLRRYIYYPNKP